MSVSITINGEQRDLQDADAHWINSQIDRRRAAGETVCVRIMIDANGVNLGLATPTCGPSGGGGRQANSREEQILGLWGKLHLNSATFTGGEVVAFSEQLKRIL